MTTINRFAFMTGLPEYGEHANIDNVNINDITLFIKPISSII